MRPQDRRRPGLRVSPARPRRRTGRAHSDVRVEGQLAAVLTCADGDPGAGGGRPCRRTEPSTRSPPKRHLRCRQSSIPTRALCRLPSPALRRGVPARRGPVRAPGSLARAAFSQSAMTTAAPAGLTASRGLVAVEVVEVIRLNGDSHGPPAGRNANGCCGCLQAPLVQTAVRLPAASTAICGSLALTSSRRDAHRFDPGAPGRCREPRQGEAARGCRRPPEPRRALALARPHRTEDRPRPPTRYRNRS